MQAKEQKRVYKFLKEEKKRKKNYGKFSALASTWQGGTGGGMCVSRQNNPD